MSINSDLHLNSESPSFFWRSSSYGTILTVAALCRAFLFGLNNTQVHGLPRFLDLLKSRADYKTRRKGLLTVSNHLSVLDDPLIWGVLPLSFAALDGYGNNRWSLASHDICFKNALMAHFFTLGQTLPTHRLAHSTFGGPFQATMTEGIRLFSKISTQKPAWCPFNPSPSTPRPPPSWPSDCVDPFSDLHPAPSYPSQPSDTRQYLAPSRYASNAYSWIHIFPEGMIHQSPTRTMRYFKWGVARLILEPSECPDVVPIFIEGTDQIMHESRPFPRFIPRLGKEIHVTFGKEVDTEAVFGDLRRRWKQLAQSDAREQGSGEWRDLTLGVVPATLRDHPEAQELRIECTRRIREEVLKLRRSRGYHDEDPKASVAATWAKEGPKREGKMEDGAWVGDT